VASIVIPKYLSIIHAFSVRNNFSCLLTRDIQTLAHVVPQLTFHGLHNYSFGKRKHIMKTASLTRYTKRKSKNRTTNEVEHKRRLSQKPGEVFSVCLECFLKYLFLSTGLYVAESWVSLESWGVHMFRFLFTWFYLFSTVLSSYVWSFRLFLSLIPDTGD